MPRWLPPSLRVRLTLWNAAVIAAVLLAYAVGVYLLVQRSLSAELDRQLHDDFEAAEETLERLDDGRIDRRGDGGTHQEEDEAGGGWLEAWSLDGTLLYRGGNEEEPVPPPASFDPPAGKTSVETLVARSGVVVRVRSGTYPVDGTPALIRAVRSEARIRHQLGELLFGMGLWLPAAVLLACLGGYFLAGRALKPVGEMAARARTITADRLGERLPIKNPDDELGRLGTVFNETLARLERSFESLRRFTADAAHELRTPLTALRSVGEVALRASRNDPVDREVVESMLEETDRLTRLIESLLTLSRADGRHVEVKPQRLNLQRFAREMVDYVRVLAEEKQQRAAVEGDNAVDAWADPVVLRQAVLNLLDNAIKHSPEGTAVRVVVRGSPSEAVLEVVDQGPGIEAEHRERIFERFYRVDKARSRATGGAGLGLSIAQWAVQASGGSIEVQSTMGEGSCFRIRLPRPPSGA